MPTAAFIYKQALKIKISPNHRTWFGCPFNILVVKALVPVEAKKLKQVAKQ